MVFHRRSTGREYPAWDEVGLPTLLPLGKALCTGGKAAEKALMERLMAALAPLRRAPGGQEGGAAPAPPTPKEVGVVHMARFGGCWPGVAVFCPGSMLRLPSTPLWPSWWLQPAALPGVPAVQAARALLASGGKLYRTSYYGCSYAAANDAAAAFSHSKQLNSNLRYGDSFFRQVAPLWLQQGSKVHAAQGQPARHHRLFTFPFPYQTCRFATHHRPPRLQGRQAVPAHGLVPRAAGRLRHARLAAPMGGRQRVARGHAAHARPHQGEARPACEAQQQSRGVAPASATARCVLFRRPPTSSAPRPGADPVPTLSYFST